MRSWEILLRYAYMCIRDSIVPLTQAQTPDYSHLATALVSVAVTYGIGILCAYTYNRIMVNVSQGTMRNIRVELFQHMESLPIRYFCLLYTSRCV